MATDLQRLRFQLWSEDSDFALDPQASLKREFARLAKSRGWEGGEPDWNERWFLLFGEEYTYRKGQHTRPILSESNLRRIPREAMRDAEDEHQEFFRECHLDRVQVHSKPWKRRWFDYFEQVWMQRQFGLFEGTGPANRLQKLCFGVYSDFTLNGDADIAEEFTRLRREKNWDNETTSKEARWCFGTYIGPKVCNVNDSESESNSNSGSDDSNSDLDSTIYTPSHSDGGVALFSDPEPTASLSKNLRELHIQDASKKSKKQRRAESYEEDFGFLIGTEPKKLEDWQKLCNILGIEPAPQSITQCKKSYSRVWVNLYNLIDHLHNPDNVPLRRFNSYGEFWRYTKGGGRLFPKSAAKKNHFLKALLHRLY